MYRRPNAAPRRRAAVVILILALGFVPLAAGSAAGEETLSELQARMGELQGDLDAMAANINELEIEQNNLTARITDAVSEIAVIEKKQKKQLAEVIDRASSLYKSGGSNMVEVLFTATNVAELTSRAEILSRVSLDDESVFITYARSTAELDKLTRELGEDRDSLAATESSIASESDRLQAQFNTVAGEYEALRRELTAVAPAAAPPATFKVSGNITCPVAGPVSFVDSWHAPRVGHLHEGTDMMSPYGTPVVAIVSGTITYAGYGGSAGNWIILSGDDGNGYWYMHNQQNLMSGGHVSVGQQIATVGDTGNAVGTPHVHFEFHPGGGEPVNPYPLLASIC